MSLHYLGLDIGGTLAILIMADGGHVSFVQTHFTGRASKLKVKRRIWPLGRQVPGRRAIDKLVAPRLRHDGGRQWPLYRWGAQAACWPARADAIPGLVLTAGSVGTLLCPPLDVRIPPADQASNAIIRKIREIKNGRNRWN